MCECVCVYVCVCVCVWYLREEKAINQVYYICVALIVDQGVHWCDRKFTHKHKHTHTHTHTHTPDFGGRRVLV